MSYQHGYQQQPAGAWQGHYPQPAGSPATAIIAAVLGLGLAGALGFATIDMIGDISDFPESSNLPSGYTILFVLHFLIVGLALLGATLVFARQLAGAFLLLTAGILAVVAIVVDPLLADGLGVFLIDLTAPPSITATGDYAAYWEAMLEFGNVQAILFAASLVVGVFLTIISALPPGVNYLRGPGAPAGHGYPQQAGW